MRFLPCRSYSKDWMIFHTPFIIVVLLAAPLTAYAHDSHQKCNPQYTSAATGAGITGGTNAAAFAKGLSLDHLGNHTGAIEY
jgi:hypothetical protein